MDKKEILAECPANDNGTCIMLNNTPCEENTLNNKCLIIKMGEQILKK